MCTFLNVLSICKHLEIDVLSLNATEAYIPLRQLFCNVIRKHFITPIIKIG